MVTLKELVEKTEKEIILNSSLAELINDNATNAQQGLATIIKFYEEKLANLEAIQKDLVKMNEELVKENEELNSHSCE